MKLLGGGDKGRSLLCELHVEVGMKFQNCGGIIVR